MNAFLTVGTTPFDSLVRVVDSGPFAKNVTLQIADGLYTPTVSSWFRFKPTLDADIENADIVICHAGAGSVFRLIQSGIVPLVVPNLERRDKHQLEITRWLDRKNYALVAQELSEVNDVLENYTILRKSCVPFNEKRFFYSDHLNELIIDCLD